MLYSYIFIISLTIIQCAYHSYAYFVTVDANAEECFFDRVNQGKKLSLLFEVAEGGFLDIDVKIYGPDNKVIYNGDRESNGKYQFKAHADGIYKYCFGNTMSTMTPKIVMFNLDIEEKLPDHEKDVSSDANHSKLEEMIYELSSSLTSVKHEQEYMELREKIHRSINESTNSRVVMWSFFEAIVLLTMTVGQVFYLKRFFEVRRVV